MGRYTEFHFNVYLQKDLPLSVVALLRFMLGSWPTFEEQDSQRLLLGDLPQHPLFKTNYWDSMLNRGQYRIVQGSTLTWRSYADAYTLSVRSCFPNYEDEIEKFVDWILPYIDHSEGKFLGFYFAEECETPFLIYNYLDSERRFQFPRDLKTFDYF